MRILVRRDTGDRLAPAIYDDLCCAQAPCVSRGRNFLYSEISHLEYVLDIVWRDQLIQPGSVAEVSDASLGETFKARASSWSLTARRDQEGALSVDYRLTLQRYPKNGE